MTTSPTAHNLPFNNALQKSIQYTNCMPINPTITSAPASPEEPCSSDFGFNSDDIVPTSALDVNDDEGQQQEQKQESRSTSSEPTSLVIVGSYQQCITLGRGGSSTVKIGRRNRQISRTHVAIEYANGRFELVVLGLNGASVDHLPYRQHERAPLDDHSFVDVLGDTLIFRLPAGPPTDSNKQQATMNNSHLSPPSSIEQIVKSVNQQQRVLDQEEKVDISTSASASQHMDEIKKEEEKDESPQMIETEAPVKNHTPSESTEAKQKSIMTTPTKGDVYDDAGHANDDKENNPSSKQDDQDATDYAENIIDILVFSRKSSMPISDICSRIIKTNPSYKKQDRDVWTKRIQRVLKEKAFFGEIVRKGKTADGSPKEHLYYYNSDMDPVEWRRATYTQVGRSARKCTLQDKQYFWRIPPKLGKNRNAYIPPPASPSLPLQEKRKLDQNMATHDDDDISVKKQKY